VKPLPEGCVKLRLSRGPEVTDPNTVRFVQDTPASGSEARGETPLASIAIPFPLVEREDGDAVVHAPGGFVFWDVLLRGAAGDSATTSVTGAAGWGAAASWPGVRFHAPYDSLAVFVSAVVPDTATRGDFHELLRVLEPGADSSWVGFTTLLRDSATVPLGPGFHAHRRFVFAPGGVAVPSGTLRLEHTAVRVNADTAVRVTAGGRWESEGSAVMADSGRRVVVELAGAVDWSASGVHGATDGIQVRGATGRLLAVSSVRSLGDALVIDGPAPGLTLRALTLDEASGDGIRAVAAGSMMLDGLFVGQTGGASVRASHGSWLDLVDAVVDSATVVVSDSSEVRRSWSRPIEVADATDSPVSGARVVVVDAVGDTILDALTDAQGHAPQHAWTQWRRTTGGVTAHTPHAVHLSYAGVDTTLLHAADGLGFVFVRWAGAGLVSVPPVGPGPALRLRHVPMPRGQAPQLEFTLPSRMAIRLEVFDLAGRRRASLARGVHEAGIRRVSLHALAGAGDAVLFARLDTPVGVRTVRIPAPPR
jgi:hypothetical protein